MTDPNLDTTQPFDLAQFIQQHRPKPDEVDMDTQRKIAKGNAVAEAFRVMMDAVGGTHGANIQERTTPANAVMGAVDRYYKAREANKSEQDNWDKMQLGAGLKGLETQNQQQFEANKLKNAQDFTRDERTGQETWQAGQNDLNRASQERTNEATNRRYEMLYGNQARQNADKLKTETELKKTDQKIAREKLQVEKDKYQTMYPYGKDKGMFISDPDLQKQINIPDNKKSQILAFIKNDPAVKDVVPVMMMKYGELENDQKTDLLIADLYPSLSPETRNQIREFTGINGSVAPKTLPNSPLLPGAQPLQPSAPMIKTDKKSTIVQVQQPANPQLVPEQVTYLQKVIQAKNYTPKQKRSAIYKYLTDQGFDEASAKGAAEATYQSLIVK